MCCAFKKKLLLLLLQKKPFDLLHSAALMGLLKAKETKKCHHRQLMQLSLANCDE
jgi:hypothetical protein